MDLPSCARLAVLLATWNASTAIRADAATDGVKEALSKGSKLTLRADRQPLCEVFAAIEKATGNRVHVVLPDITRDLDDETSRRPISLDVMDISLWKILDMLDTVFGLGRGRCTGYRLELSKGNLKIPSLWTMEGKPIDRGAFRAYAARDSGGDLCIGVQPAPWVGVPRLEGIDVKVKPSADAPVRFDTHRTRASHDPLTGHLIIPLNPQTGVASETGGRIPELEVAIRLEVAHALEEFTLPRSIAALRKEAAKAGVSSVRVAEAKKETVDGVGLMILEIEATGHPVASGLETVIDAEGNPVRPLNRSELGVGMPQEISLFFRADDLPGSLEGYRLRVTAPTRTLLYELKVVLKDVHARKRPR